MAVETDIAQLSVNALRVLSIDMVQRANSGHPGTPLGIAPLIYTLWRRVMRYNPADPSWLGRDRFVLSAGHAVAVQYAALYLTGYDVSLDDLKQFRQWGARTAGHPEAGLLPGIEVTTGPLGQGFGMGVGMAIARNHLAARYNREGFPLLDHAIYVVCSDGDMMEGISHEAASLAGTLRLGRLVYVYDRNRVSIDGPTDMTFQEDVGARFRAYGWRVIEGIDANDLRALEQALREARDETQRPSLIIQDSHIGYASPLQDSSEAHGKPLGEEGVRATKERLGYPSLEPFYVPEAVLRHMREAADLGAAAQQEWEELFQQYSEAYPDLAAELRTLVLERQLPHGWDSDLPEFPPDRPMATRAASGKVMAVLAERIPTFMGGAADLATSGSTLLENEGNFTAETPQGRNVWYGVREHAMGAITNGLAKYGGIFPYDMTFLIFSDYMRPALRIGALMHAHAVHIFTHDSIGLGEDGPTHQPVEHLPSLRAIPNFRVIRPADANETREAWRVALRHTEGPTALILTRQAVPVLDRSDLAPAEGLHRGAYVLWDSAEKPELILIATGSEVAITLQAGRKLAERGVAVRVVSMPSWELFQEQDAHYRESVLPGNVLARVSVEAACPLGWERWTGPYGTAVGVERFGHSAPGERVMAEYGFTVENIIHSAEAAVAQARVGAAPERDVAA